jgi:hypothetical protein
VVRRSIASHRRAAIPRFDRIDPCTQFSRLRNATGMPTEYAGDVHEDEELAGELRP